MCFCVLCICVCVVCGVCMYIIWTVQRWDFVGLNFTAVLALCIQVFVCVCVLCMDCADVLDLLCCKKYPVLMSQEV